MVARKTFMVVGLLLILLVGSGAAMVERRAPAFPPLSATKSLKINEPWVMKFAGDTTWIQVHADSTHCPGDPLSGHGGEATGGPGPSETWCFEGGDSCGTLPPWNISCFSHEDVRALPSQTGINFWHIDTYRADQRLYCGNYALWCGSDSIWTDGYPVECGTWATGKYPGYGNLWNCVVELTLPGTFDVAMGCTLMFDPRYDTECKYDYFYVDFWNDSTWVTLAVFNATSDNPGAECGAPSGGNPDYWGNTDTDNLLNCDWQERSNPSLPAFYRVIPADTLVVTEGPRFRWRFVTDGAWSDADGRGDTDGGAWVDNVIVRGDSEQYTEGFETGVVNPAYWSLPDPDGVADPWHMVHDPDPPYEGGDGGYQTSCLLDSSYVYRARPEGGYPGGVEWRNGWFYRLMTPAIPITNTGCVVQYDAYECVLEYTCDYTANRVRFYDSRYSKWCPWTDIEGLIPPTCWANYNINDNLSPFYGPSADSVQYCWEIVDVSSPGDLCRGKHKSTDFQVDNFSIGFFDASATVFSARSIDLLQDTFFDTSLCAYNSYFDAYDEDTVDYYAGERPLPKYKQLYLDVSDKDSLITVELYGSITNGASWVWVTMTMAQPFDPGDPALGGEYYGTLCPSDFGLTDWAKGTIIWYYVKATDNLANEGYFPAASDPSDPAHTGKVYDYLTFAVLPIYPDPYTGPTVLLVDGYGRTTHDWAPCLEDPNVEKDLEEIYGRTLADAGYCYDVYDINGAGSNVHIQPIWFDDYDAIVWFTGPYFSNYLLDAAATAAMLDYLNDGGKIVLCGDRLAYYFHWEVCPPESLCGEALLEDVFGVTYIEEMPSSFIYPYVYTVAESMVNVFGSPVALDPDTLLLYRECPEIKEMSFVLTNPAPVYADNAQSVMYVSNVTGGVPEADQVVYTEHNGQGQCVFVNFDLSGCVNHEQTYCPGVAAAKGLGFPPGGFNAGNFAGRVKLMQMILQIILGLPSSGSGQGGTAGAGETQSRLVWGLAQNVPNPCVTSTRISYEVARPAHVRLSIYNTLGQVVRVIEDRRRQPGTYSATWDGRNTSGERVSSGVYFYKIEAGAYQATRKMLLVK